MAITERSRKDLLDALEASIGKDPAMTLAEHLPPVGWADVATKADLRALQHHVDGRFEQVDLRFGQVDLRFEQVDLRFEQIDARFEQMDLRFEQIDARFEQIDARFEQIDARFEQLDDRFEQLRLEIRALRSDLFGELHRLLLVYGLMGAGTVVAAVVGLGLLQGD